MPYTTLENLETRYGAREIVDLADRDRDGVADAGVVDAAIAQADQIIDSYLGSRFTVPLLKVPGLVGVCADAIARYQLAPEQVTEKIKEDYTRALKWLGEIRDGKMDVGIATDDSAPEVEGGGPRHTEGRPAFPVDALDRWAGE